MNTRNVRNLNATGFTLIEVMITVGIIAILAAVALPSYFDYVTRSRLVQGKTFLVDMRTRLEQFFLDHRTYPESCIDPDKTPTDKQIRLPASAKFFDTKCALTATTYTVTATGIGSMAGFVFTVNEANARATTGVKTGWAKPNPNTCWASRKNGEC